MSPSPDAIEALCALDAAGRGIGRLVVPGALAAAARSLAGARRVVLVTGFVPRPTWGPETDGPSGTVVLGRALRRLGAEVRYLADPPVLPLIEACLKVFREPLDLVGVPAAPDAAVVAARASLRMFRPSHLVAVERPGRAADGDYYNARGESVRGENAPLDALFLRRPAGAVTIGVGDGGNENGMGRVRARVRREVPRGDRIGSVVRTDHLVVAGTSNWGAWGLTAHLGLATGQDLLHTGEDEVRLTHAMVAAGGVDGLTGAAVPSVDSLPLGLHQAVLTTLRELAAHLRARVVPARGAGRGPRQGGRRAPARHPEHANHANRRRTTSWPRR
jgi:hypothetical protein